VRQARAGLLAVLWLLAAASGGEPPLSAADEKFRLAGALFARGEFARAADRYADFARRYRADPRASEATFRRAESLYRSGDDRRARTVFEECLKLKLPAARLAAARMRVGAILYAGGDPAAAAAVLKLVRTADLPGEARAAAGYFLGASLSALGRGKEAVPHLRVAAGSSRAEIAAPALLELARAAGAAGRRAEADGHLKRLLEKFPASPQAPEAGFRRAEMLRADGKAAEALPFYSAVLRRSPPGDLAGRAALGAGWGHLGKGQAAEALKMADLAGRVAALKVESDYLRGLALTAAGRHAEAEEALTSIVRTDPAGARAEAAACRVAWCRYLGGKHAAAGLAARDFRARYPRSRLKAETAYVEGLAAEAAGDVDGALAALDAAAAERAARFAAESAYRAALVCFRAGREPRGRARLEKLVAAHPGHRLSDPALVRLGEISLAAGEVKKAKAHFEKHLASFAGSPRRPAALLGRALCAATAGEWDDFKARCTQLAASHPADARAAEASYWLAWNHERLKQYDLAARAYTGLIAKHKSSPLVYEFKYRLCCAYYLNANFPKAAEGFLALARSGKRRLPAEVLVWLGQYLGAQKRDGEAKEVYALAASSTDPAARAEARLALGHRALQEKRPADAVKLYREIIADDPAAARAAEAGLGLARALRESGKPAEALAISSRLLATKDERTRLAARGEAALARLAAGDAKAAAAELEPLAVLYDDSELVPRWLAGLAAAEEKLGRKETALKRCRELVSRFPASPEAREISKLKGIPLPKGPSKPGTDF
jgi:TolA-binding protein